MQTIKINNTRNSLNESLLSDINRIKNRGKKTIK